MLSKQKVYYLCYVAKLVMGYFYVITKLIIYNIKAFSSGCIYCLPSILENTQYTVQVYSSTLPAHIPKYFPFITRVIPYFP